MTIRSEVLAVLKSRRVPMTAMQIVAEMDRRVFAFAGFAKLSSVSSVLRRMVDDSSLVSFPTIGPRQGNGYMIASRSKAYVARRRARSQ